MAALLVLYNNGRYFIIIIKMLHLAYRLSAGNQVWMIKTVLQVSRNYS